MIPEIIIDPPLPLTLSPSLTKEVHCRKGTHSSSPPRKTNELDLTRREGREGGGGAVAGSGWKFNRMGDTRRKDRDLTQ